MSPCGISAKPLFAFYVLSFSGSNHGVLPLLGRLCRGSSRPVGFVSPSIENRRGKAGNGNKEEVNRIFILNCLQFALSLQ